MFAVVVAAAALFWVLTEPDVQNAGVEELVERRSDAVAFFTYDYVFVVVYGVIAPVALWRFGASALVGTRPGTPPAWLVASALLLGAGALFDAVENTVLLLASSNGDAGWVDLGHALAVPKYALGGIGGLIALRAVWMAARTVRAPSQT